MAKKKIRKRKAVTSKKAARRKAGKKTAGRKSRSRSRAVSSAKRKALGWRRYLRWRIIVPALIVLGLVWVTYLDVLIRVQFEGKRWALPAQVYARPLELYAGEALSPADFRQELEWLGYRYRYRADEPGTVSRSEGAFRVYQRAFQFWDGEAPARRIDVRFADGRIETVSDTETGRELDIVRLEPPRIGGIYPAHHEDRILIKLDEAPLQLREALVAVEDRQFYQHFGVNPRAIARALWANIRAGGAVQGGSTLTQQLVKNFFLTNRRSLWRKANEALMALLLEWHYSKDEILEAYLNEIYLGQESSRAIHGFGLASRFYFDRPVQQLTTAQIATLVALVRGPSYYNPHNHPKRLLKRRNLVLEIMAEQGVITADVARRASQTSLGVVKGTRTDTRHPAFMDLVRRQLQRDYRKEDLTSEGLKIFTTFDPRIQQAAEQALSKRIKALDQQRGLHGQLQGAVVVTNTTSGEVLALVADKQPSFAGFNRALDAVRPIGSLIKPAVYLSALEQPETYTLSTALSDTPIRLKGAGKDIWAPRNYDGKSHGTVPLFVALVHSYNQATVRLGMQLGFERIADMLQRLGAGREIPAYPSMLLGAVNFSPYEVTGMYQTLAAGGFRTPLRAIREVLTVEGEPLRRFPLAVEQVVDPASVAVLVSALHEVTRSGTARSLASTLPEGLSVAGKTGTTNDLRDSWFAGFSGNHLAVVWLGQDDNQPTGLTGSSGALRVWTQLMKTIPNQPLLPPATDDVEYTWIDSATGLLSRQDCDGAAYLAYIRGTAPEEHASCAEAGDAGTNKTIDWFKGLFE